MMSRLMLNLHSSAATGIFTTTVSEPSSIAFTSRAPDLQTLAYDEDDNKNTIPYGEMELEYVVRTVRSQQEEGVYEIQVRTPAGGEHV